MDRNTYRRQITDYARQTRPMAAIKPGRVLGGVWMDRFVSDRRNVVLCADCVRKYGNWHVRNHYRPQPAWLTPHMAHRADCDGCGEELAVVTRFFPEERYFASLIGVEARSGGSPPCSS